MKLNGVYKGVVIDTDDPAGYNRVRVRIPSIHGTFTKETYGSTRSNAVNRVADNCIPWAEVCIPYTAQMSPQLNQVVAVSFLDGDQQYPVVLGYLRAQYTNKEEQYS
jgi:hypothetical protein